MPVLAGETEIHGCVTELTAYYCCCGGSDSSVTSAPQCLIQTLASPLTLLTATLRAQLTVTSYTVLWSSQLVSRLVSHRLTATSQPDPHFNLRSHRLTADLSHSHSNHLTPHIVPSHQPMCLMFLYHSGKHFL